jgi:hypothetical protein
MFEVITNIEIDAKPEHVWKVLSNFDHYQYWNPFITQATLTNKDQLSITTHVPNNDPMSFNPQIIACQENIELRWVGTFNSADFLKAEHYFILQETPTGTKLVQGEIFSGTLTESMDEKKQDEIKSGFMLMNDALAREALKSAYGCRMHL